VLNVLLVSTLQKHFGVDLPHGVIAHMDPILIKKIDWETTNNLEDWDITLDVSRGNLSSPAA